MSPADDFYGQARPSYQAFTSGNDAVRTEDMSFSIVNIFCYVGHCILVDHRVQ